MKSPKSGGRGCKAPYETIHYRIPVILKPTIIKITNYYKEIVGEAIDKITRERLVNQFLDDFNNFAEEPTRRKEARDILQNALLIKGNCRGAIKTEIKKALEKLQF